MNPMNPDGLGRGGRGGRGSRGGSRGRGCGRGRGGGRGRGRKLRYEDDPDFKPSSTIRPVNPTIQNTYVRQMGN